MLDMLPTPEAIALLEEYFSDAMEKKQLHSFYTCCGKCSDVSEAERARIQSQKKTTEGKKKGVDMSKHSWLTDRKTSFVTLFGKTRLNENSIVSIFIYRSELS